MSRQNVAPVLLGRRAKLRVMSAEAPSRPADGLLRLVECEAAAARAVAPRLTDDAVAAALRRAAELLAGHKDAVLAANAADVAAAEHALDAGALDRLTLDDRRIAGLGEQLLALAELPPLEREIEHWTLDNGLTVSARRIPIGVVGANFEARPGVALDVAGQLLKSLNACILRTGSAALSTVTTLVDEVLRPALADVGAPPEAVGLVRDASRDGAVALVSLPRAIPLVILRGSGETTRRLARVAALEGVRVLAHAEGGGVLYVDAAADAEMTLRLIEASVDRLGVCNRLNLLLVHRDAHGGLEPALELFARLGLSAYGTRRAREYAPGLLPLDVPLGHEWANDPLRVASVTVDVVDDLAEAAEIANTQVSGLAAAVVTESARNAETFLGSYRGTAAFWNAPTRFTDGFALMGAPETGINVDAVPGPRGPVTYRDLWLRQLRVIGDGTQRR
jgi:glutamate-5-semialdehyde dehydrogenase